MLLHAGETYRYNGETRTYPSIKLVYWAGGNPFHHHQDLDRLRKAFAQLDTLVVHELAWTATARHADFVLPCTMTLEREDIGGSSNDPLLVPMRPVVPPYGEARDDYAIFADLAERLGARAGFTGVAACANGWSIYTNGRGKGSPARDYRRRASRNSGTATATSCRRSPMTGASCAPSEMTPKAGRYLRRAAS